jgi:hypothetical protein
VNGDGGGEFWKIHLNGGEILSIDFSDINAVGGCGAEEFGVAVYAPTVTDATLPSAKTAMTTGGSTFSFVAPSTGTWTLFINSGVCGTTLTYDYAASLTPGPSRSANGSATIEGTPELIVGSTVASGWSNQPVDGSAGGEFWKVHINAGETLAISFSNVNGYGGCGAEEFGVSVYAPTVTDATLPSAKAETTGGGSTFDFAAPSTGTWTLFVNGGVCGTTISYDYAASLSGPGKVVSSPPPPPLAPSAHLSLLAHIASVAKRRRCHQAQMQRRTVHGGREPDRHRSTHDRHRPPPPN